MNRGLPFALIAACVALSACGSDSFYRGMYEGSRIRQDALRPMDSVTGRPATPDFDQYEAERRRLHPAPADATPETPSVAPR